MNKKTKYDDNSAISVKVVLLGEVGVGKTCIINRYINNTFNTNSMSTTGVSYAAKQMHFEEKDKSIKFDIWDTSGQEKYRSLNKIFYKDALVAILVYDICKKNTFEEIVNYWYEQVKEQAPKNVVFGIAANKSDLYEHEEVLEETGRKFSNQIGAVFKYTSAKNDSGINDLFKEIGMKILDPSYNFNAKYEDDDDKDKNKKSIKISSGKDKKKDSDSKCC